MSTDPTPLEAELEPLRARYCSLSPPLRAAFDTAWEACDRPWRRGAHRGTRRQLGQLEGLLAALEAVAEQEVSR